MSLGAVGRRWPCTVVNTTWTVRWRIICDAIAKFFFIFFAWFSWKTRFQIRKDDVSQLRLEKLKLNWCRSIGARGQKDEKIHVVVRAGISFAAGRNDFCGPGDRFNRLMVSQIVVKSHRQLLIENTVRLFTHPPLARSGWEKLESPRRVTTQRLLQYYKCLLLALH